MTTRPQLALTRWEDPAGFSVIHIKRPWVEPGFVATFAGPEIEQLCRLLQDMFPEHFDALEKP